MGRIPAHITVLCIASSTMACTVAAKQAPEPAVVSEAPAHALPGMERHDATDRCFPAKVNAWMREGLSRQPTEIGVDLMATYRQQGHVMTVRVRPTTSGADEQALSFRLDLTKEEISATHDDATWELDGRLESWNLPGVGLAALGSYTSTFDVDLSLVEDTSPLAPLRDTQMWADASAQATGIELLRLEDRTAILRSHNGTLAGMWTDGMWWYDVRYSWPRATGPGMGSDPIVMIDTLLPFTMLPCTQISKVLASRSDDS